MSRRIAICLACATAIPPFGLGAEPAPVPTKATVPARPVPLGDEWQGLSLPQFADLAIRRACSQEAQKAKGLPPQVAAYAFEHYLSNGAELKGADAGSLFKLISAVTTRLSKEQKGKFATLYYKALFFDRDPAQVKPPELIVLGWGFISSGLYEKDQKNQHFPEFAKAVAVHVASHDQFAGDVAALQASVRAEGLEDKALKTAVATYLNPFWYTEIRKTIDDNACPFYRRLFQDTPESRDYAACYFYGKALSSDEDRQTVKAVMVDEKGLPRMGAVKVLTWSYRRLNQLKEWGKVLEEKAKAPDLDGDGRAKWFLARAYAEEAQGYEPSALMGLKWVDQALGAAASENLQLECLDRLVNTNMQVGKFNEAKSLLASNAPRLSSDTAKVRAEVWLKQIDERQQVIEKAQASAAAEDQRLRAEGKVRTLSTMLDEAKKRGDPAEHVASLEQALATARQQLKQ